MINLTNTQKETQPTTAARAIASVVRFKARGGGIRLFRRVNIICLFLMAVMGLTWCSCKKETKLPSTPPENLKPVNPNDSPKAQEEARLAVLLAMRRGDPPATPTMKLNGGELASPEVLEAYNTELLRARLQERRSPESLDDLVRNWIQKWRLLPNLPVSPPGKRIVYDELNCIIRLDPP